jgi:hypothetical protein
VKSESTKIVLNGYETWDSWLALIRRAANEHRVWVYCNPYTPEPELPALIAPTPPTTRQVRVLDATDETPAVNTLTPAEIQFYSMLRQDYRDQLKIFQEEQKALAELCSEIQRTIHKQYDPTLTECNTARAMLVKLKALACAKQALACASASRA